MLAKIIDMIDSEQWLVMGADVKGDIYEKLLEQNAQDVKSGAGQYFTPRPLIRAMVECIQPQPLKTIADPACGTGGFFLAAYDYLVANNKLDKEQNRFLKLETFYGNEIVASTRRLALMNMFLHNIGDIDSDNFISPADALIATSPTTYDYVLANPPFGKKSSQTFTNEHRMTHEAAIEALLTSVPEGDLFVVTTGKASHEVFELRERLGQPHERDFLTVGSMGHAGMVALGLAKARPERTVWCVDGDGAMLMHMGALAVEAQQQATNLIHVVLNNGAHESVGGMPVAGGAFWFAPVAHAVGFEAVFTAESIGELKSLAARVRETASRKLCFLEAMVSTGARADLGRPTQTPRQNLQSLMETIQNGGTKV